MAKVNEQLSSGTEGRLFAVIHTLSRQYLVKSEDVIVLRGYFDSDVGETIRFEKVCNLKPFLNFFLHFFFI